MPKRKKQSDELSSIEIKYDGVVYYFCDTFENDYHRLNALDLRSLNESNDTLTIVVRFNPKQEFLAQNLSEEQKQELFNTFVKKAIEQDIWDEVSIPVKSFKIVNIKPPYNTTDFLITFDLSEFVKSELFIKAEYKCPPEAQAIFDELDERDKNSLK